MHFNYMYHLCVEHSHKTNVHVSPNKVSKEMVGVIAMCYRLCSCDNLDRMSLVTSCRRLIASWNTRVMSVCHGYDCLSCYRCLLWTYQHKARDWWWDIIHKRKIDISKYFWYLMSIYWCVCNDILYLHLLGMCLFSKLLWDYWTEFVAIRTPLYHVCIPVHGLGWWGRP